jgi:type II secretory pathway predicted ATPase ExeA
MGKTTLMFQLLERFRKSASTAFLFQTQCTSSELLEYILLEMGLDTCNGDPVAMNQQLNRTLLRVRDEGKRFILVIDEAQNLAPSVLETVRLLSDFESPAAKLLQIILAGQPELEQKLADPSLVQLRQRISIIARLEPFTFEETSGYIDHRLRVAGHTGPCMFSSDALALIARSSEGIPRVINNLCFNALSLGYALGKRTINSAIVREVLADLDLRRAAPNCDAPITIAKTDHPGPARAKFIRFSHRWTTATVIVTVILLASFAGIGFKAIGASLEHSPASLLRRLNSIGLQDRASSHAPSKLPLTHRDRVAAPVTTVHRYEVASTPDNVRVDSASRSAPSHAAILPDRNSTHSPATPVRSVKIGPQQTLWQISRQLAGRQSWTVVNEICALNPGIADPNHIFSGQVILLPIRWTGSSSPGLPEELTHHLVKGSPIESKF